MSHSYKQVKVAIVMTIAITTVTVMVIVMEVIMDPSLTQIQKIVRNPTTHPLAHLEDIANHHILCYLSMKRFN